MSMLDKILRPVEHSTFFNEFYEKEPLHLSKDHILLSFSESDLSSLIRATAESHPLRLRANLNGRVLAPPRAASPTELCEWANEVHANGATLVINYIESLEPRSRSFATALGKSLNARVTLTVFITPKDAQGFPPHFDTLDVFVFQVKGSKNWRLGSTAIQLPTLRQGYLIDYKGEKPPVKQLITMVAGDVLYIPRGLVHWASTSDEASMHITADICTLTDGELLSAALRHHESFEASQGILSGLHQRLIDLPDPLALELPSLVVSLAGTRQLMSVCEEARLAKWARKR